MDNQPDWIEWAGGYQPVADAVKVEVRLDDGRKLRRRADGCDWARIGDGTDIVAYRALSQAPR